ncbi:MAG TPA: DUF2807 domain-containing protein, partial [Burkholderiaceae bacterium]|nr:DUF2807 domain-containing protein [Burkholderiaceae bacterium]
MTRGLLKVATSLLLLALLLIGVSYSMLRSYGRSNPSSAAGRAPGSEVRKIGKDINVVELSGPIELTLTQGDTPYL